MDQETLLATSDRLAKMLLDPPTPKMAIKMIAVASKLHISAVTGLLVNTIHCQESLDGAYILIDEATAEFKRDLIDCLEIMGKSMELKVKSEPTPFNEQLVKDIMADLEADKK